MVDMTTSTVADNSEGLTFDKLMATLGEFKAKYQTVFYIASDYAPIREDGKIVQIDNNGATPLGYDIICHTSQIEDVVRVLSGEFIIRRLDAKESDRRLRSKLANFGEWFK